MCCAKNLNGHPRYVSSALTDHARGSCGPTLPWNSGEAAGGRSRLPAAQSVPDAPDKWRAGEHLVDRHVARRDSPAGQRARAPSIVEPGESRRAGSMA